jgi:hypothetical protein
MIRIDAHHYLFSSQGSLLTSDSRADPAHSRRNPDIDTVSYLMLTGDKPFPSQFIP